MNSKYQKKPEAACQSLIRHIGMAFVTLVLFCGCNDYLDVTPRSQIKSDVIYSTETGYKEVLMGVYINMSSSSLYGGNMTMYVPEMISHTWNPIYAGAYNALYNQDYTNAEVESLLSAIYLRYYSNIVQLNDLLTQLERPECAFQYNNDKLMRGEALGLRAFLHLELLRFFGPVPVDVSPSAKAIPYTTTVTNEIDKLKIRNWSEVVSAIENDLTQAEALLKDYDPITKTTVDTLRYSSYAGRGNAPMDEWQFHRQCRMNYYAVLATKARLYHWIGDKANAVRYARQVVDERKFSLVTGTYFSTGRVDVSLSLYPEFLFGLQNPDLQTTVNTYFKVQTALFTQSAANLNVAYENSINANDFRNSPNLYWEDVVWPGNQTIHHFRKYSGNTTISPDNRIPLIRLPEMYLILSEDLPLGEAMTYFTEFRTSRAMDTSVDESSFADESSRMSRMEKEYRKEFMGEGQMFFFYKHHNYSTFTWPSAYEVPANAYNVPLPKGQTSFDNI
ncbi:MAG: RagB/SusD family nutrient uptake outer membrane protein [Prevotella sp.]|nr:RagB/SusD family nutrient uptake outer membrane protein [Prevotella sp.]